ncbi:fizzy [Carabus blaptoides fortunei]
MNASTSNKTPTKRTGSDVVRKKTPSKTPSKSKSPSRSTTPTPNKGAKTPNGGDRFIPSRSNSNFDLGHFKINQATEESEVPSPQKEMQRIMSENLHGNDISKQRILAYQNKAPEAPEGFQNPMRIIYTQTKTPASVKSGSRYIPQAPDRILDAPDIIDDYYLNLMDWSANNLLAVALGSNVYLWNAGTGNIEQLPELEGNDYVCSLSWIQEGDYLAVGTTTGTVELWDCSKMKRLRIMEGHSARVGALSWNSYILSSGCRSGQIIHHDVRQRDHIVASINGHSQEVCGLKWSTDGKYLASGGNDNVLNIWQAVSGSHHSHTQALHTFTSHQAAVKALAWCPWKPNILASGGGTADRCIKFWNVNSGTCLNTVDTKSQVCSLLWSSTYSELVSGHGFANNQLIIWKYPLMNKVAELTGHTARVLHLAMSPDGSTVLSAGADETLRLWKSYLPEVYVNLARN